MRAPLLVSTSEATHSAEIVRPLGMFPAEATTLTDYYKQNVYESADQKVGEIVDLIIEKYGQIPATMIFDRQLSFAEQESCRDRLLCAADHVQGTRTLPRAGYRQADAPKRRRLRVQPLGQTPGARRRGKVKDVLGAHLMLTARDTRQKYDEADEPRRQWGVFTTERHSCDLLQLRR
jgi:hypothetical protein